ncbi:TPA: hypothetical protein SMW24_000960 [Pseudomonas aeruginosa]|nr:hypothetical protein [Pseudomonas aeruginosa]
MMRRQASVLLLVSMVSATVLPVFARAPGEREPSCAATSIVLPAGARYPNGIAHAADGTLYVGLVTSGRILRKPPGGEWETFFAGSPAIFAATALRLDEPRGLLWGNSPDFLPAGRRRPHGVFALDLATGAVRRYLTLPGDGMGNDLAVAPDGTVYLSETRDGSLMRLRPGEPAFQVLLRDSRLAGPGGLGAAGIVRVDDDTLLVGNFGSGAIHVVGGVATRPRLREMELPRTLENPDGMALAPDGSLIVLENAIRSGAGKVLRIAEPLAPGRRGIEVIREGLESPVNLTVTGQGCAYVSESRIRHRLLPGREGEVPARFLIHRLPLDAAGGR